MALNAKTDPTSPQAHVGMIASPAQGTVQWTRNSAMNKDTTKPTVGSGAERMRRHGYLRKLGLRSIPARLHEHEISALVACALLDASQRQDPTAVAVALELYLDRNPIQAM